MDQSVIRTMARWPNVPALYGWMSLDLRGRLCLEGDPVMHGETDCLRSADVLENYDGVDLYTTLSPCMMCTGAILNFGIRRVVVGENVNFPGNIDFLRDKGVEVLLVDDPDCKHLMSRFIEERPDIWFEDIGED